MPTNSRRAAGFTVLELMIGLGLTGLGVLSLMATNDYIVKSTKKATALSEHTKLRNLVQLALTQKSATCTGISVGSGMKNCCGDNLKGKGGALLAIPSFNPFNPQPIISTDNVELSLTVGGPGGTQIINSGEKRANENLQYEVRLIGHYRDKLKDGNQEKFIFAGKVELIGKRTGFLGGGELRALIPIEFEVFSGGGLSSCISRPIEPSIAINANSIGQCEFLGGVSVPSEIGNLCRFSTDIQPGLPSMGCPDPGFLDGDPFVGCVADTNMKPILEEIPDCPSPWKIDPKYAQGNLYCSAGTSPTLTQPNPNPPPPCPVDPYWLPDDYPPNTTPIGWIQLAGLSGYNPADNIRHCKYNGTCPSPGVVKVVAPPAGDGVTPSCVFGPPTQCPPSPWVKKPNTSPLTCFIPPTNFLQVPSTTPKCPDPFLPVPPTNPDAAQWNAADGTHIVCY